jgi:ABC-type multidrug transport system fused ATPase/permease subunit
MIRPGKPEATDEEVIDVAKEVGAYEFIKLITRRTLSFRRIAHASLVNSKPF